MTFPEFQEAIRSALASAPQGMTWRELKAAKALPYDRPCPTWVKWLESGIGLRRVKGSSRSLIWTLEKP